MRRLLTLLLTALVMTNCTAQQQRGEEGDPYAAEMEAIDLQGEAIMKEYRMLIQKDPKAEKMRTKKRINQLADMLDSLSELQLQRIKEIIRDNQNNLIPVPYISAAYYEFDYDDLKAALNPKAAYYNHPRLNKARIRLAGCEKRAPGTMYKDMVMKDTEGNDVSLSQWVGKGNYVLIDFWASWCRSCLQEMPNVVRNYIKYHPKGFEIVGVSLDERPEIWKRAARLTYQTWPQISDLKGWKSDVVPLYGVTSIPCNMLIDPQGKIIAIDLHRKGLGDKLKEIYGE